jgi:adenosylcobinamide kinase/adenosylcobinamide-phosphate guanylyltransferase
LIDSLGTWVANLLEVDDHQWEKKVDQLILSLKQSTAMTIIVAEETNWGIVPHYHSARLFRNRLGTLNRMIAAIAQHVYLVVAGHALDLRVLGQSINPANLESEAKLQENVDSQNSFMPDLARLTTLR